jgi:thermostable 8-oxoguanine DNA glycosylase
MEKEYATIKELIQHNLSTKEHPEVLEQMSELKEIKGRGFFTKEELIKMGMWKSPRPKRWYLKNSEEEILLISREVLSTKLEKRKIELLTKLKGVRIPTASAILTLIDPENYGVIDIRVWRVLHTYGSVKEKSEGKNLDFNNWYNYLMKLRYYAKMFNVKSRDIERTIFQYHKKIQVGNLYK